MSLEPDTQWHRDDLVTAIFDVLMANVDEPCYVLAPRIVDAVEDWSLDDRFSGREKWIRFAAWERRQCE